MKMSIFIDYHGISKIAKIRITLIVCLFSAATSAESKKARQQSQQDTGNYDRRGEIMSYIWKALL